MYRNEFQIFYDYLSQNLNSIQCMTEESAKYLTELMSGSLKTISISILH